MSAKTLVSVRIPAALANRLHQEAENLGLPLSAYVRHQLEEALRERDMLTALNKAITHALGQHDARIMATLTTLLDQYTRPSEEMPTSW